MIDYLRERRESEASLADVVALAEITAESFNAFVQSMDTAVYKELREIATYITTMRVEIGALQANDLKSQRDPGGRRELDAIVQATAEATNTIMACAESIMAADASDPVAYKAFVDDADDHIFEACSFQDITGQRIRKVVDTLRQIEIAGDALRRRYQCPRRGGVCGRGGTPPCRARQGAASAWSAGQGRRDAAGCRRRAVPVGSAWRMGSGES